MTTTVVRHVTLLPSQMTKKKLNPIECGRIVSAQTSLSRDSGFLYRRFVSSMDSHLAKDDIIGRLVL